MNLTVLMGRLTADPETRNTQDGKAISRYTLAVDRRGKDKGADFIRCVCFDRAAEFAERYLHKGTKISVTGRLHTDSYNDRDGKKVYTTDVVVSEHHFCDSNAQNSPVNRSNGGDGTNTNPQLNEGFEAVSEGLPFN